MDQKIQEWLYLQRMIQRVQEVPDPQRKMQLRCPQREQISKVQDGSLDLPCRLMLKKYSIYGCPAVSTGSEAGSPRGWMERDRGKAVLNFRCRKGLVPVCLDPLQEQNMFVAAWT